MKKLIALLLAMMLVLSMAACGVKEAAPGAEASAAVETEAGQTHPEEVQAENQPELDEEEQPDVPAKTEIPDKDYESVVTDAVFTFRVNGAELIPSEVFDASVLGEAEGVHDTPSYVNGGNDTAYDYGSFRVVAYHDEDTEVIYSIRLTGADVTTSEGLGLSDGVVSVLELYGDEYENEGSAYVYTLGNTQLYITVNNGVVSGIEYRAIVEGKASGGSGGAGGQWETELDP